MVGLSVVLEAHKGPAVVNKKTLQVINKATMIVNKPSSSLLPSSTSSSFLKNSSESSFLEQCFLCRQKLLPGKDIYMYKGDTAFCSVECRCRQIFMDEEETLSKENCSLAAMKAPTSSSAAAAAAFSTARHRKSTRSRGGGYAC